MQPQGHLQVITSLLNSDVDPQNALDQPRFYIKDGIPDGKLLLEDRLYDHIGPQLAQFGHQVERIAGRDRSIFGLGQIIRNRNGILLGGTDPRGDGCVIGF